MQRALVARALGHTSHKARGTRHAGPPCLSVIRQSRPAVGRTNTVPRASDQEPGLFRKIFDDFRPKADKFFQSSANILAVGTVIATALGFFGSMYIKVEVVKDLDLDKKLEKQSLDRDRKLEKQDYKLQALDVKLDDKFDKLMSSAQTMGERLDDKFEALMSSMYTALSVVALALLVALVVVVAVWLLAYKK